MIDYKRATSSASAAVLLGLVASAAFGPQEEERRGETEVAAELAEALGGVAEYRLWDGARVDILTDEYAIEVDWSKKWAEGVGQAAYYGAMTGRRPVVLLLVRDWKKEQTYAHRAATAAARCDAVLWLWDETRRVWIFGGA